MSDRGGFRPVKWLLGVTQARLTGALPAAFLNECARRGVPLYRAEPVDECTLRLTLRTGDLYRVRAAAERCGCALEEGVRRGAPELAQRVRRRAALCAGMVLVLLALFWSSLYIWEIEVRENPTPVADGEILRVLERCGVGIGSFWPGLRADMIAAQALPALPELCALTVNVRGSRAEVLVRGCIEPPELLDETTPTDVVAARAGVVTAVLALEGESQVRPGDSVLPGELLISARRGGTLSGERLVHARGAVTAQTWRTLTAFAPLTQTRRVPEGRERTRFAAVIGKTRVNFLPGSSISGEKCAKITNSHALALENVFTLPLALVRETRQGVTLHSAAADATALERALETRLLAELARRLDGRGSVTETYFTPARSEDALYLTLRAECLERIDVEMAHSG